MFFGKLLGWFRQGGRVVGCVVFWLGGVQNGAVSGEWGRKVVAGVVYWDGVWRAVFEANILANVRVRRSAAVVGL